MNHNKRWTNDEDLFLLAAIEIGKTQGFTNQYIADNLQGFLGRSLKSVGLRIGKLNKPVDYVPKKRMSTIKDSRKDILEVEAYRIEAYGAFCKDVFGNIGLLHISNIAEEFIEDIGSYISVGDKIKVKQSITNGKISYNAKEVASIKPKNRTNLYLFENNKRNLG